MFGKKQSDKICREGILFGSTLHQFLWGKQHQHQKQLHGSEKHHRSNISDVDANAVHGLHRFSEGVLSMFLGAASTASCFSGQSVGQLEARLPP